MSPAYEGVRIAALLAILPSDGELLGVQRLPYQEKLALFRRGGCILRCYYQHSESTNLNLNSKPKAYTDQ